MKSHQRSEDPTKRISVLAFMIIGIFGVLEYSDCKASILPYTGRRLALRPNVYV
jgi:hypothetical protein